MNKKICMFGDSVGKGVIFDSEKQRYSPCKQSFSHLIEVKFCDIISNHCKFGCTVSKGEEIIKRHADSLYEYDYVLLQYGGNDCDFNWEGVAANPDGLHQCYTPLETFKETYIRIINLVKNSGSKPVLMSVAPVDCAKYFKWITRTNNSEAIMRFLGTETRIEHWNEVYNNAVWNLGLSCKVPVIDIRSPFLYERDFSKFFCDDGIHPNAGGHRLIADYIYSKEAALL